MSNYTGLYTFDVDNHKYLPVGLADGLITDMDYHPEKEPLITDLYPREAVRNWLFVNGGWDDIRVRIKSKTIGRKCSRTTFINKWGRKIEFDGTIDFTDSKVYEDKKLRFTITELCGEEGK